MATKQEMYAGYLEKTTTYSAKCGFCGEEFGFDFNDYYLDTDSIEIVINHLIKDGWGQINSAKYSVIDLACKGCVNKKDEDR